MALPARGAGPLGPADLARHGPALGPGAGRAGRPRADDRATSSPPPRSATRWSSTPRSAARRTCCSTSRPSPSPPACAGRRSTTGTRSTSRSPGWSASCPTGRIYHPTVRAFLAGGVPEVMLHLRALGLLDEIGPHRDRRAAGARARLVGSRASGASGSASGSSSRTASIPTT